MTRASIVRWHTLLLAAAGVAPTACGSTDSEPDPTQACTNPVDLISPETGYVTCDGGWIHRPFAGTCPSTLPQPTVNCGATGCPGANEYCVLGECPPNFQCRKGCTTDAECESGNVCLCAEPIGHCVVASCKTDSDCGGRFCIGSVSGQPIANTFEPADGFHCQTDADTCVGDADCPTSNQCKWNGSRHECFAPGTCGRPFLVDGRARTAEVVSGSGWRAPEELPVSDLSLRERELLAGHYAEMAAMEHASIAAFARFVLELLALGAPADLVQAAEAALGDEIQHARLCFALASGYAGTALGPGPLPLGDAFPTPTLVGVAMATIHEACIGETLAAIEAAECAECATVPEVRSILERIANDEMRHAVLGWRFLRWALDRVSFAEGRLLAAELNEAIVNHVPPESPRSAVRSHGMLTAEERGELQHVALREVIRPLASRLVSSEPEESGCSVLVVDRR